MASKTNNEPKRQASMSLTKYFSGENGVKNVYFAAADIYALFERNANLVDADGNKAMLSGKEVIRLLDLNDQTISQLRQQDISPDNAVKISNTTPHPVLSLKEEIPLAADPDVQTAPNGHDKEVVLVMQTGAYKNFINNIIAYSDARLNVAENIPGNGWIKAEDLREICNSVDEFGQGKRKDIAELEATLPPPDLIYEGPAIPRVGVLSRLLEAAGKPDASVADRLENELFAMQRELRDAPLRKDLRPSQSFSTNHITFGDTTILPPIAPHSMALAKQLQNFITKADADSNGGLSDREISALRRNIADVNFSNDAPAALLAPITPNTKGQGPKKTPAER